MRYVTVPANLLVVPGPVHRGSTSRPGLPSPPKNGVAEPSLDPRPAGGRCSAASPAGRRGARGAARGAAGVHLAPRHRRRRPPRARAALPRPSGPGPAAAAPRVHVAGVSQRCGPAVVRGLGVSKWGAPPPLPSRMMACDLGSATGGGVHAQPATRSRAAGAPIAPHHLTCGG